MPTFPDYHVHTDSSIDCKTPMIKMCDQAVALGLTEIAFTDHFNNHLLDIDLGYYQADRFFAEIERCRAQFPILTIRAGVELGEPHRWHKKIARVVDRYPYDVMLGSLHWLGNDSVFSPNYYRARTPQAAVTAYFEELIKMVKHGGFDILAHVDLPKRTAFDVYGRFNILEYEAIVRELWQACIDNNITPEINTKGMRCSVRQLHPTVDALRWYVEMGGKNLTFGSDAHQPDSLAGDFDLAWQTASAAGIKQLCRYERRRIIGWLDV